jgi:N-acetylneuraminate synthase
LDATVSFLKEHKANFSILQCTTSYPTKPQQYGFNVIQELKERYGVPVGFSDHSAQISTGIAAVALGAEIIEVHVVLSKNEFGPDVTSSLTTEEARLLVKGVQEVSEALQHPIDKNDNSKFTELKNIFEKSLAVNKDLERGHILQFQDLEAKKPKGFGIDASQFESVIGKELVRDLKQWDFLTEDTLDQYE